MGKENLLSTYTGNSINGALKMDHVKQFISGASVSIRGTWPVEVIQLGEYITRICHGE
jgi:hypothetical protein